MAYSKVVSSLLIALISSLISCVQINVAVINLHNPNALEIPVGTFGEFLRFVFFRDRQQ